MACQQVLATIPIWPISTLFVTVLVGTLAVSVASSFFISSAVTVATAFGPDMVALYLSGLALVGFAGSASAFLLAYISNDGGVPDGGVGVIFTFSLSAAISLFSLVAFILAVRDTETYQIKFGFPSRANSERDPLSQAQARVVLDHDDGIWSTTRRNWGYNFAQCWLWIVTMAAFPAITTHVVPTSIQWPRIVFRAFHLLVFSAGDFVGRSFVSVYPTTTSSRRLLTYSALQTTLAPLFLLCNLDPSTAQPIPSNPFVVSSPPTPVIGDIGFLVLVFAFALTSGYAASLGFVAIGSEKGAQARSGARVLQLWMSIGYVLGSVASFGVGRWWM